MNTERAGGVDIALEHDDWSVKAVSASDPWFWLRVETPGPGASAIVVTDAMLGRQDEAVLASALAQILAGWNLDGIERIVFADILPGCGLAAQEPEKAGETVRFLTSILNRALAEVGLQARGSALAERRGKLDCVFGVDGAAKR